MFSSLHYQRRNFRSLVLLAIVAAHAQSVSTSFSSAAMHGVIHTPGHPVPYRDNLDLQWDINVPDGFRVRLFITEFDLEPGTDGCSEDYVTVLSGNDTLGKFCGRTDAPDAPGNQLLTSQTSNMEVKFHSDYSNEHRYTGFMAHYVAEDIDECEEATDRCDHFCHNYLGGYYCSCKFGYTLHQDKTSCQVHCSGNVLEAKSGIITSPGYPVAYPRRSECDWLIRAEAGYVISLTFEDFDVEDHPDAKCPYDALRIKQDDRRLGPFCGRERSDWPEKIEADKLIRIYFISDESGENRGFLAKYSSAGKPCRALDVPRNGFVSVTNATVGNTAVFGCNEGYSLDGPSERTCLASGEWSGNASSCQVVRCNHPPSVRNGQVSVSGRDLVYGTAAVYSCVPLYELRGIEERVCQADGTWSGEEPKCIPICGISSIPPKNVPRRRIVGGREARSGSWPWVAHLSIAAPNLGINNRLCGGSLISESWVLTAAHCLTVRNRQDIYGRQLPPESVTVTLGTNDISKSNGEVRRVTEIIRAPSYDALSFDADVALLRLDQPVTLTRRIRPICVPDEDTFRAGEDYSSVDAETDNMEAVVIGWGTTGQQRRSDVLNEVYLPVIDRLTCEEAMGDITENMVCAGTSVGGQDSCFGDSGGPLMLQDTDTNKYYAFGLVSWGEKTCAQPGQYGVYAKVGNFVGWIQQVVQI